MERLCLLLLGKGRPAHTQMQPKETETWVVREAGVSWGLRGGRALGESREGIGSGL